MPKTCSPPAASRALRADDIVSAVADAARRWTNADFPPRVRATRAIVGRTGYTEPVVEYALDLLFGGLERATLRATIAGELGSLEALDGFVARAGRPDVFFRGLERVAIVSSDSTIGVAIPALAFALCAKCRAIAVKEPDDRLVAAFAETIAEERPELGAHISAETWRGADDVESRARLGAAQAVVAYGGREALVAIRARLQPEARFVAFGHRTSVGYVAREALPSETIALDSARAVARDALLYDGEGCLSSHATFVERAGGVSPAAFAQQVAAACDELAVEFPAGYDEPDPLVAAYARAARFRAAQRDGAVYAGVAAHVVVFDPPRDEPPPLLRRTVALYAVDGPAEAGAFVRRHRLPLEAVGLAGGPRDDVTAFAVESGASRLAALGSLQDPPLGGEHGGAGRILPFVRAIYR